MSFLNGINELMNFVAVVVDVATFACCFDAFCVFDAKIYIISYAPSSSSSSLPVSIEMSAAVSIIFLSSIHI